MSSKKPLDHYRLPADVRPRLDIVNATKVVTFNVAAELDLGPANLIVNSSKFRAFPS